MSQGSIEEVEFLEDATNACDQPTEEQIKRHNDYLSRWNDALRYLKARNLSHWSSRLCIRDLMRKDEHEELKVGNQPLITDVYFECACKKRISLLNIADKQTHLKLQAMDMRSEEEIEEELEIAALWANEW